MSVKVIPPTILEGVDRHAVTYIERRGFLGIRWHQIIGDKTLGSEIYVESFLPVDTVIVNGKVFKPVKNSKTK